jgi:hypothetical protein
MSGISKAKRNLVERFGEVLISAPRGVSFVCNMHDAIVDENFPPSLAADFFLDCSTVSELDAPASWGEIQKVISLVAWDTGKVGKYRFQAVGPLLNDADGLFFIVDVANVMKDNQQKFRADVVRTASVKPVNSTTEFDVAARQIGDLIRSGKYRPGIPNGIFWISRHSGRHQKSDSYEGRCKNATTLRDRLGLVTIEQGRMIAEIAIDARLNDLQGSNLKVNRPTFAEGFDMEVFRHRAQKTVRDGWGRAIDLKDFCGNENLSAPCDGWPELVLEPLNDPQRSLRVLDVGRVARPAREGFGVDEFSARFTQHVLSVDARGPRSPRAVLNELLTALYGKGGAGRTASVRRRNGATSKQRARRHRGNSRR